MNASKSESRLKCDVAMALKRAAYTRPLNFGTGLLERVGTGIVGTIGYVVLPTGVSNDVSRDIV